MKITLCRSLPLAAVFFASAVLAHAHPGHDGDELTWDFGHLAAHPLATAGCALVLVAGAWGAAKLVSASWVYLQEAVRRRGFERRD